VLALMRFCMAIKPPNVVLVSAQAAISMAALGAEALGPFGVENGFGIIGSKKCPVRRSYSVRREARVNLRKSGCGVAGQAKSRAESSPVRSAEYICVLNKHNGWPWPEMPALKRGFKL